MKISFELAPKLIAIHAILLAPYLPKVLVKGGVLIFPDNTVGSTRIDTELLLVTEGKQSHHRAEVLCPLLFHLLPLLSRSSKTYCLLMIRPITLTPQLLGSHYRGKSLIHNLETGDNVETILSISVDIARENSNRAFLLLSRITIRCLVILLTKFSRYMEFLIVDHEGAFFHCSPPIMPLTHISPTSLCSCFCPSGSIVGFTNHRDSHVEKTDETHESTSALYSLNAARRLSSR